MSVATVIDPLLDRPVIVDRDVRQAVPVALPEGLCVVSADSHLEIADDIFVERFPEHLKAKAPRVWFDQYWHIGYRGEVEALKLGERGTRALTRVNLPTVGDVDAHLAAIEAEGIEFEILFPQTLIGFIRYPDLEVQEAMYRVYNEYTIERLAANGGRSVPVGVFSNWWDPAAAERAMRQIVDLGYKTFMVPCAPGKDLNGRELSYADEHFDRFWALANEAGLPVCFHIGEAIDIDRRGGVGAANMVLFAPFRRPFGQLVFGGVFDRHPNLQVVFAEGGIAWVPPALQDAEAQYDIHQEVLDPIEHRPSHYWHTHCSATFQNDRLGLSQIDLIGADRMMWASDYPHSEGSYGYGRESMKTVVDMVGEDRARLILGENAIRVFKLDA
ncbi:MAG: amidohydrolase [Novosphingobium sp.]|nr:amidohydrolase [Novosphingobium sp.]